MKSIEKDYQKRREAEIRRANELDEQIDKAMNTMSTNTLIRLFSALCNYEDESLSEKQRQSEWNKVENIFMKEISRNEKKDNRLQKRTSENGIQEY